MFKCWLTVNYSKSWMHHLKNKPFALTVWCSAIKMTEFLRFIFLFHTFQEPENDSFTLMYRSTSSFLWVYKHPVMDLFTERMNGAYKIYYFYFYMQLFCTTAQPHNLSYSKISGAALIKTKTGTTACFGGKERCNKERSQSKQIKDVTANKLWVKIIPIILPCRYNQHYFLEFVLLIQSGSIAIQWVRMIMRWISSYGEVFFTKAMSSGYTKPIFCQMQVVP